MGVILWGDAPEQDAAIVLVHEYDMGPATSDVKAVRTGREFGCLGHTRLGTYVRTVDLRHLELQQMRRTF